MQIITASAGLKNRILQQIHNEQMLERLRIRMAICSGFLIVSVVMVIFLAQGLSAELGKSGFFDLLHLVSSDWHSVVTNLNDYALSLLEALPILTIVFMMTGIATGIVSLLKFLQYSFRIKNLTFH